MVVSLTVGQAFIVKEAASPEGLSTVKADKALRVPLSVQGRDVVLHDRLGTPTTLGGKHSKVILFAVRLAILLVEVLFSK